MGCSMPKPRIISLYTGAGGLDYGFEAAGFEHGVTVEMDPDSCATLRANRPWAVIERDIFEIPSDELLHVAGLKRGEPSLVIGGPPCQPFSKSGYWARGDAGRLEDPRAGTLGAFLRVVEDTLPQAFLLENVQGLAFQGKAEGLHLLLDRLDGINRRTASRYRAHVACLNAAGFGVPQLRERVFVIASREGKPFRFPAPTHGPAQEDGALLGHTGTGMEVYRTAWDALADVTPDPDEDVAPRGKWAGLLPSIPEGQNYLWHTERGGGLPLFGWRRRYWTFLLKLAKGRPSWTIQAQPGPAVGPFHWESRRLSMRELCRLQTFPDDVRIVGSRTSVQRQVGNAVPSLLGEVLAREIRVQLLDMKRPRGMPRLLPPKRIPVPPPERARPVPNRYRTLIGEHEAHPGSGKGYGALRRGAGSRATGQ